MIWVLVAVTGGLGAVTRVYVDGLVSARMGSDAPWGTWAVNVSGSFAAGLVLGAGATGRLGATTVAVVAGGFLGAFTTFSTAMVQVVGQLAAGRRLTGALHLVGALVACVAAAGAGAAVIAG